MFDFSSSRESLIDVDPCLGECLGGDGRLEVLDRYCVIFEYDGLGFGSAVSSFISLLHADDLPV